MTSSAFISPYKILRTAKVVLPKGKWCLIYDSKLKKHLGKISGELLFKIPISAGEKAKTFKELEKLLAKISRLEKTKGAIEGICVLGGGSLGDLASFAASIYRRGVRLVIVPSTYLSVIDSAFGGKTAVNFSGAKNQVGSFYPAELVLIHTEILPRDKQLLADSFAEILKMAILESGLWKKLSKVKKINSAAFWSLAAPTIEAKLKIVKKDPREKLGLRNLLKLRPYTRTCF
jgi:3-dehydroquinate synthase